MIKQVLRKSLNTVKEHIDKSNFQKNLIFSLVIFPFLFVPYIIIDILVHLSNNQEYFKLLSSISHIFLMFFVTAISLYTILSIPLTSKTYRKSSFRKISKVIIYFLVFFYILSHHINIDISKMDSTWHFYALFLCFFIISYKLTEKVMKVCKWIFNEESNNDEGLRTQKLFFITTVVFGTISIFSTIANVLVAIKQFLN
ncbi:hypothetical protein [Staphylococcus argenteus]|uniref:hypothetical protein n=1 Tax=Staphylococcus argenteus TaxID=985002 RepID=UPI000502FCB4|nr:hypothetical protein [Staphylococcus argenteus]MBE2134472.1 hypothetical protein [Staphylococcus argenteus]MBE2147632.1 hypothetical protein [Staphylococcus argenteus]MBE2162165.1 hypothetical protein [Staphylococcus argenteus]MCG9813055.1 hypothetical protein [Staphylococcus argenteus]MCG9836989.1 hypothetical protein [Staphylococcus argenteus]